MTCVDQSRDGADLPLSSRATGGHHPREIAVARIVLPVGYFGCNKYFRPFTNFCKAALDGRGQLLPALELAH
jgi:hypothetical protein